MLGAQLSLLAHEPHPNGIDFDHSRRSAHANPAAFMSLLGKVLPMTIADTAQNEEIRIDVSSSVVWPKDKDGNIIWPDWAKDKSGRAQPINGFWPV
jgi:hypothetical protein